MTKQPKAPIEYELDTISDSFGYIENMEMHRKANAAFSRVVIEMARLRELIRTRHYEAINE